MRETGSWNLTALGATVGVTAIVVGTVAQVDGIALIDTGCDLSRIQQSVFDQLLPPGTAATRTVDLMVEHPDGTYKPEPRNVYAVSIAFPTTKLAPTIVEMMPWEIQKVTPGITFLLGRDFLAQCEFLYDGILRTFSVTTDRP